MDEKENFEVGQSMSNVDKLLELRKQKGIVEEARPLLNKANELIKLTRDVITLQNEKWDRMYGAVDTMQEDVDFYTKEYIMPLREKEQELEKLQTTLVTTPERQTIVGKIGGFFEKFIPGITKAGREKRKIDRRIEELEEGIETDKIRIEKIPFQILGTNKDVRKEMLDRMNADELEKHSTTQNDPKSYLKPNRTVQAMADNVKRDDMMRLLSSYPSLKSEANNLLSVLMNDGVEAFNAKASEIIRNSRQVGHDLVSEVEIKENGKDDILDRINNEIDALMEEMTPEELAELESREEQKMQREAESEDKEQEDEQRR